MKKLLLLLLVCSSAHAATNVFKDVRITGSITGRSALTNSAGQSIAATNDCATKQYATWMTNTLAAPALIGALPAVYTNDCATINRLTLATNILTTTNQLWFSHGLSGYTNAVLDDTATTTNLFAPWVVFTNIVDGKRYKIRCYPDQ